MLVELRRARRLGLLVLIAACVGAAPARAEWPASGRPLAVGPTDQLRPVGLTGPGGEAHVFWTDVGSPLHVVFAQHLTLTGALAPGWPEGGRGVVVPPAAPARLVVVADGSGGALLTWFDYRAAGGPRGIYALRVDAEASIATGWNAGGTPICTSTNPQGLGPLNDLVAMCGDGAGGAFIAWTDARHTPPGGTIIYDVFAHHVLADGTLDPAWPATGRGLTSGPGYKYPHALVGDGSGGFWLVSENSNATYQVAATHHGADGAETGRWTTPSFTSRPVAMSDGAGGLFLGWRDCRDCAAGANAIYVIRLGAGAAPRPGWPADGLAVVVSSDDVDLPVIVPTGVGAAMLAWLRTGQAPDAYVARRVEADGTFAPSWPSGGRVVAQSADILSGWPLVVSDGAGGAMFAFRRNRPNVFGSRVDAMAQVPAAFPDTGLALCSLTGDQFPAALVSDGLDGAFVLWEDRRDFTASHSDLYVMRFTREGGVGSTVSVAPPPAVPGFAMSAPRPNPGSAWSTLDLSLREAAPVRVEVLDLAGRRVAVLHDGILPAGTSSVQWDGRDRGGRGMPPGVYLARARTASGTLVRRIVRLP